MGLSPKDMTIAAGLLWAAAVLCVGIIHRSDPGDGVNLLPMTSSL